MDHDVMHRQVQGLMKFRTLVEQFLQNAGHDLEAEAGVKSLSDRMTDLEAAAGSGSTGAGLADRITALEGKFADFEKLAATLPDLSEKLADLPAILDGVSKVADLADRKTDLLAAADWVAQNSAPVGELLKIGDDLADPAAEPATGTAGDGTGATAAAGGTNPAPDSAATPSA